MQRQSESIASLAAALAKAQIELQNPEKSLIGSIEAKEPNAPERLFRYASLASGLEIVRKTLGQHDIATVQTTTIDQGAGIVSLTTVLAHASGEWIASDWPVCPISETATPHRMGAALTYARRYALFTLVGIAGEDDLDAPDLVVPTPASKPASSHRPQRANNSSGRLNAAPRGVEHRTPVEPPKKTFTVREAIVLDIKFSAKLRDEMLAELNDLGTSDEAARWAKRRYPEKTTKLNAADAAIIDQCFRTKIISFATHYGEGIPEVRNENPPQLDPRANQSPSGTAGISAERTAEARGQGVTEGATEANAKGKTKKLAASRLIDKSMLSFAEPRRIRDREHMRYVAQQSCLVCGRKPSDAHHLRFAQGRAIGRKVSDEFTVPLCRGHHRALHRHGNEMAWWRRVAIEPLAAARRLWLETHPELAPAAPETSGTSDRPTDRPGALDETP